MDIQIGWDTTWLNNIRAKFIAFFGGKSEATLEVDALVRLPEEDSGHSICRVPNRMIDRKKSDRSRFWRNESIVAHNPSNGTSVVLRVMGTGRNVEGQTSTSIAVDYDTRDALGIASSDDVSIVVRRATGWDIAKHHWSHPNPVVKHSYRLGVIGAAGVLHSVLGDVVGLLSRLF